MTIHSLAIKFKKSNHKLLFSIAKSIVLKVMKPAIQKVIEKAIKDNLEKADAYAWEIQKEVNKAKEAAKKDPENAQNIFQSYLNAFQKKALDKKKKAEKAAKDTQVNLAVTKEDSMFKSISLPGGISTKATEYKQLAEKGDRWESPIFGIGSARGSSNIPTVQKVTRKPHSTRSAGVRGGNHPNASNTPTTSTVPAGMANKSVDSYTIRGPPPTMPGVSSGTSGTSGYGSTGATNTSGLPTSTGTATAFGGPATTAPGAPSSMGASNNFGGPALNAPGISGPTGASTNFGGPAGTSTVPSTSSNLTGFSNQVDSALNPSSGVDSTLRSTGGTSSNTGGASFYDSATRQ